MTLPFRDKYLIRSAIVDSFETAAQEAHRDVNYPDKKIREKALKRYNPG
jgi:hypothetical protein